MKRTDTKLLPGVLGLAIGDACGMPYECCRRGAYDIWGGHPRHGRRTRPSRLQAEPARFLLRSPGPTMEFLRTAHAAGYMDRRYGHDPCGAGERGAAQAHRPGGYDAQFHALERRGRVFRHRRGHRPGQTHAGSAGPLQGGRACASMRRQD